jgi:hypothetical protein
MWYIVVFGMYAILFSLVFGFTTLVTTMFLLGSFTLAFGLTLATYSSLDRSEWAAWSLAVVGAVWSIGWSLWALFDRASASIFVTVIDMTGTIQPDKLGLGRFGGNSKNEFAEQAESRFYWQFMNPFAGDGVYAIFWFVNMIFYLWYAFEWLVGPQAPISGGFGIVDETGVMLASDVFFFGIMPFGLLGVWFWYDPGTWRISWFKKDLAKMRYEAAYKSRGEIAPIGPVPEEYSKPNERGSIRKVNSKHTKSGSSKGKAHIVLH